MRRLSPNGTVRERFPLSRAPAEVMDAPGGAWTGADEDDDFEASYFGWEIARCARRAGPDDQRAIAALAAACVAAMRAGSTRVPLDEARLQASLAAVGPADVAPAVRALLSRWRAAGDSDPAAAVLGLPGDRKPLIIDGEWLYSERMRVLEQRFCARVLARRSHPAPERAAKGIARALAAITAGPPALRELQRKAVREALSAPLALITGGPGTGKTTIVVALLRALAWSGTPMGGIAIAAPTGKAAQRIREAIAVGLASSPHDIAEAALPALAPVPQTLHRLLGWSPASGRFARHENDPLPHQVVIVDEASMVDLALMDRLVRALSDRARLVLLGDADQLPSVEAGAVFRDLCAGLPCVRLTENLRVARDESARRIVSAAEAVNRGELDARFTESVTTRRTVREVAFVGVEHLAAPWTAVGDDLLERFFRERIDASPAFAAGVGHVFRAPDGVFDDEGRGRLEALFEVFARSRILCATRAMGRGSAEAINRRMLGRIAPGSSSGAARRGVELVAGAPVVVLRNDYERQLFNGDQGVVVRVDAGGDEGDGLVAVFRRDSDFISVPVTASVALAALAPAFAMTVHKAQGSEFDDVTLVLPEIDLPLSTRELVYTAMTRARRSVLLVGAPDLLARAVARSMERHSGIAETLASPAT